MVNGPLNESLKCNKQSLMMSTFADLNSLINNLRFNSEIFLFHLVRYFFRPVGGGAGRPRE